MRTGRVGPARRVRKLASRGLIAALSAATLAGQGACVGDPGPRVEDRTLRPNGDVVAAGQIMLISDSVPGDIMMAGQTLEFDGFSEGSYLGAGGSQSVGGDVRGSVRAMGGAVEVAASIGRNVTLAGLSITVQDEAAVDGNAYLAGGSVRFEGAVSGDLYVGAGDVVLDGRVGGDVRVEAGALRLGPDARIDGELRYRLEEGTALAMSAQSVVTGAVVELEPRADGGDGRVGFFVLRLLAFVLCAVAVVALFPGSVIAMNDELKKRPGAALGFGLLWVVLAPVAVIVAAITMVGIPLAVIGAAVYGASLYLAPIVPALWVGAEILGGRDRSDRRGALLLAVTGGAIVAFAILLPWIGFLARILATCAGLGAVVLVVESKRATLATGGERMST